METRIGYGDVDKPPELLCGKKLAEIAENDPDSIGLVRVVFSESLEWGLYMGVAYVFYRLVKTGATDLFAWLNGIIRPSIEQGSPVIEQAVAIFF